MNKTYLVARREYIENLRTKTFWLGIFFFPVILVLSIVVPMWLEKTKDVRYYAVYDKSGWLQQEVEGRAASPDLGKIFTAYLKSRRGEGDAKVSFPPALDRLAPQLEKLESDGKLFQFANLLGTVLRMPGEQRSKMREMLASFPEEVRETYLQQERDSEEIVTWWRGLDAQEARRFEAGLSKGRYQLREIDFTEGDPEKTLRDKVNDGSLFAAFVIGDDPVHDNDGHLYISNNFTDHDLKNWFVGLANAAVKDRRFLAEGVAQDVVKRIQTPLDFGDTKVSKTGEASKVQKIDKAHHFAPIAFVYLLWMAVFMISQALLTNTVEEKSNRTIEVLLSSVSPLQLMSGKIAGIAATGLTVVLSWVIFFFLGMKFLPVLLDADIPFDLTFILRDWRYLSSFVGYFLLGYLLFASLLVGIGSVCNSLKEAQNLMMPVSVLLMLPLFAMFPVGQDPNGTLARVLSYVPPMTPFIMMNRAAGPPPMIDYVATTILLLATIAAMFWAAAKVFRIGILMTGKPPKVREIFRWLRAPVGAVPEHRD